MYGLNYNWVSEKNKYIKKQINQQSRVLLEKMTVLQLVKKFPAFYGNRKLITAPTTAHHLSLSWAKSVRSKLSVLPLEDPFQDYPPIYDWVFQLVSFPQVSPQKPCMHLPSPQYITCHAQLISSSFVSPE